MMLIYCPKTERQKRDEEKRGVGTYRITSSCSESSADIECSLDFTYIFSTCRENLAKNKKALSRIRAKLLMPLTIQTLLKKIKRDQTKAFIFCRESFFTSVQISPDSLII